MNLIDLLTSPWAIHPDKLLEIQAIYATHLRGEKIDLAAVEARIGRPLANEQKAYEVRSGGVGVLRAVGVMAPRANLFMQVSGGISTQMLARQLDAMHADSAVRSVLVAADSPGGSVFGIPAAANALRALAADKPTVVVGEGQICSAMCWVATAANAVFIEGLTDMVGSIGVYARVGWNPKEDNTVELVRGKYKRLAVNGEAPNPEVLAHYEGQIDYLYSVFVETVAQHRGVSAEQVIERMADGRVFIGQQAIDAGLVDGVSTVAAMVERLATNPAEFAQRRKAVFALGGLSVQEREPVSPAVEASTPTRETGDADMADQITRESLERDHAALFAQVRSEGVADGRAQGAQTERDRVAGVRASLLPGHEALIEQMVADGTTTPAQAAAAVIAAERAATAAAAAAHRADAPPPAPRGNAGGQQEAAAPHTIAKGAIALFRNIVQGA